MGRTTIINFKEQSLDYQKETIIQCTNIFPGAKPVTVFFYILQNKMIIPLQMRENIYVRRGVTSKPSQTLCALQGNQLYQNANGI